MDVIHSLCIRIGSLVLISQNKEVTSNATTHSVMQMCTTCLFINWRSRLVFRTNSWRWFFSAHQPPATGTAEAKNDYRADERNSIVRNLIRLEDGAWSANGPWNWIKIEILHINLVRTELSSCTSLGDKRTIEHNLRSPFRNTSVYFA